MNNVPYRSKLVTVLFLITVIFFAGCTRPSVNIKAEHDASFPAVSHGVAVTIVIDPDDAEVVSVAAQAVSKDIQLVTGIEPVVTKELPEQCPAIVLAGTLGKNRWLDQLVKENRLNVKHLQANPWESYLITVVKRPFTNIRQALVIAGSDRRGTAYGLFELSEMAGVSPWVWWADVMPEKKPDLYITTKMQLFGPPSVQYRGIFLNDEDFGLKPWAAKTYEPETKDIGPKTYAAICELLLRLKANYLWPAMHGCTGAFNSHPDNKVVADRYAIVMGASHCEPLLFNNASEWDSKIMGEWRYDTNRDTIYKTLDKRVSENAKYENLYTTGMRGIHDSSLIGNLPMLQRVSLMEQIIHDEREILERHTGLSADKVPQIFVPYKEVQPIYDAGLKVPDDITLVWADDNYGYIRRFSNAEEQKRSGGAGIYYHISYWGRPHCYLWLETNPPAQTWKEMRRAWETNARRVWIVNVGDIKPGEIGTEFFLQMGWDINRWNEDNLQTFLETLARRDFGDTFAKEISDILNTYYVLNFPRKPEFMGYNRSYRQGPINDPQLSNDECTARIEAFDALLKHTETVYDKIPPAKRDAYYQLVLYPVLGAAKMNEKMLYAYKSRECAKQQDVRANIYAEKSTLAYEAILAATDDYNNKIAGGKWRYMMDCKPRKEPVFDMPPVGPTVILQPDVIVKKETTENNKTPNRHLPAAAADIIKTAGDRMWKPIPGLGHSGKAMGLFPMTRWRCDDLKQVRYECPVMDYKLVVAQDSKVHLQAVPAFPLKRGKEMRCAVAVDEGPLKWVTFDMGGAEGSDSKQGWDDNVLNNVMHGDTDISIPPGTHKLRIWGTTPDVILDKIIVRTE